MTKTCLDCLFCKIKFSRQLTCKKQQWMRYPTNVEVLYSESNIADAQLGNSRYLNGNRYCEHFNDMDEDV